jgi:hypothetical protein
MPTSKCKAWSAASLGVVLVVAICVGVYFSAPAVTLEAYLAARLGVAFDRGRWMAAEFPGYDGANSIAVVKVIGGFITEDGDWLPVASEQLALKDLSPHVDSVLGLRESEEWLLFHQYIQMPPEPRRAVRIAISGLSEGDSAAIRELIPYEVLRLVRMLRDQSVAWSEIIRLAKLLERLAQSHGVDEVVLQTIASFRKELVAAFDFRQSASGGEGRIMRAIRSEIDSVGGLYTYNMRVPFPGVFSADFRLFTKAELRALLDFWDSSLITRSSVIRDRKFVTVTLGEKIRVIASELTRIGSCSPSQFSAWLRTE